VTVVRVSPDAEIYRHAQRETIESLEREIERLRADLDQAEGAMVAIESGLRTVYSRADAISSLAEARIAVERLDVGIPWRMNEIREARAKLDEAERQFQADHPGSAVSFASRAQRFAQALQEEARKLAEFDSALFVNSSRVNLRGGPSTLEPMIGVMSRSTPVFPERREGRWILVRTPAGSIGWVHAWLVSKR
jgi:chromosome segregation ATPase